MVTSVGSTRMRLWLIASDASTYMICLLFISTRLYTLFVYYILLFVLFSC